MAMEFDFEDLDIDSLLAKSILKVIGSISFDSEYNYKMYKNTIVNKILQVPHGTIKVDITGKKSFDKRMRNMHTFQRLIVTFVWVGGCVWVGVCVCVGGWVCVCVWVGGCVCVCVINTGEYWSK